MTGDPKLVDDSLVPRLVAKLGGEVIREVTLADTLTIGRAGDNDLILTDPKASRHHARVEREHEGHVLTDLGSTTGTWLAGNQLTEPHALEHGERFVIGDTELTFRDPGIALEDTIAVPVPVPPPQIKVGPPPPAEPTTERSWTSNRGLVIALGLLAAVLVIALVAILLISFVPSVREQLGLADEPTATVEMATAESATSPASTEPAATEAPTLALPSTPTPTPLPVATPETSEEYGALLAQAEALTLRSKFEDAIAVYEVLTEEQPDDPRPEIGWAWVLIYDDEADEALEHAQRAAELDPNSAEAKTVLARAYVEIGAVDEALEQAQGAVELDEESAGAHAVLAQAYWLDGQEQEAVDEVELALELDSNHADARRVRAWLHYLLDGDTEQAVNGLQSAAGLQPELWLRLYDLGVLLSEAENYGIAVDTLESAVSLRPKATTYSALGEAHYWLEEYDEAEVALQQAVDAGADDANTYALLAAVYVELGNCGDAETYAELALDQAATHPLALDAMEACDGVVPTARPTKGSPTPTSSAEPTPKPTKRPAAPSVSGRIVFPVWNGQVSNYDTYIANADGSGRQLAVSEMHQPALRPDGQWLVVNAERRSQQQENLYIVKPDGSNLREITGHIEDGYPAWSLDGKQFAFASYRHGDKKWRIYIVDNVPYERGKAEGRTLNYGPDDVRGQMPAWTSDGRIVYRGCHVESARESCSGTGLFVMSSIPGPQTPEQLTEHPEDMAPASRGNTVAFMSSRDGDWEIYSVNLDGTGLKQLTNNSASDGLPAWSPNGKNLAFVSNQGGPWAIWAMAPDGSNRRKLFDIGGEELAYNWLAERIDWGQ